MRWEVTSADLLISMVRELTWYWGRAHALSRSRAIPQSRGERGKESSINGWRAADGEVKWALAAQRRSCGALVTYIPIKAAGYRATSFYQEPILSCGAAAVMLDIYRDRNISSIITLLLLI